MGILQLDEVRSQHEDCCCSFSWSPNGDGTPSLPRTTKKALWLWTSSTSWSSSSLRPVKHWLQPGQLGTIQSSRVGWWSCWVRAGSGSWKVNPMEITKWEPNKSFGNFEVNA